MRLVGVLIAAAVSVSNQATSTTLGRLVQRADPIYCAGPVGRNVALTFDDGPSPYTSGLARVLRREHARATFFLVGSRIALWPAGARAATAAGEIGNHTWSHPHLAGLSRPAARSELERTQREVRRVTGSTPRVFRPPYEEATQPIDLLVRSLMLLDVRWSVDAGDSRPGATSAAVLRSATAGLRPGAIVLLHDPHPWTASVARRLIRRAHRRGLNVVTVTELLARQPPTAHQLSSRGAARCPGTPG